MDKPFSRKDLTGNRGEILSKGRWANADLYLYRRPHRTWVVKDFMPCALMVRKTWGQMLVRREYRALSRLQGIAGTPECVFLMDAYALCYSYIGGRTLRETPPDKLDEHFFYRLEALVENIHQRRMVHLDIRNRRNVLVREDGTPALLDFQSSLDLDRVPRCFHGLLKEIDLSGVYKLWRLKKPGAMDAARKARLAAMNRRRFLWILRGYPMGTRRRFKR